MNFLDYRYKLILFAGKSPTREDFLLAYNTLILTKKNLIVNLTRLKEQYNELRKERDSLIDHCNYLKNKYERFE